MVAQTYILLGTGIQIDALVGLLFFSTLFIYLFQRFNSKAEIDLDTNTMLAWVRRRDKLVIGLMLVSLIGSIVTFFQLQPKVQLAFGILAAISCLYSINLFGSFGRHFRLRDVGWLKTFVVALVWAGCTGWLPALQVTQNTETSEILMITLERFLFLLAITLPFDIRDLHYDKGGKTTSTLPMVFGIERIKRSSIVVLLLFMLVTSFHYGTLSGTGHLAYVAAFLISGGTTAILLLKVKDKLPEHFYTFYIDGTILFQFLILLLIHTVFC